MTIIGSVKEDLDQEKRISITPEIVKKFTNLGFSSASTSKNPKFEFLIVSLDFIFLIISNYFINKHTI